MAAHILGGSCGPGKALWTSGRVNRRGGDGRGLEARVAKLEATTEHIQSDVADLKVEVRELRTELKAEVTSLRTELKTEVKNLRTEGRADFRLLFGAILTVVIGMVGLLLKSFGAV